MQQDNVKPPKNEEYFRRIYELFKKTENLEAAIQSPSFNNSEMRLIGEILMERKVGGRLISTRLADRLGITRSAISQMVNKMEARGVVKRVPDDHDRKIAYIELTPSAEKQYKAERKRLYGFVDRFVKEYGKKELEEFLRLSDKFFDVCSQLKDEEEEGKEEN